MDNFMRPGNLQGGFNWYVASNRSRMELIANGPPELPKIEVPARILWGEDDPILKARWADRLGDYFADYAFDTATGAGHFVHYEKPELANRELSRFFGALR